MSVENVGEGRGEKNSDGERGTADADVIFGDRCQQNYDQQRDENDTR